MKTVKEANRRESCDFEVNFKDEAWQIEMAYITPAGDVAWYDGNTCRDGVRFYRTFSPTEIKVPVAERQKFNDWRKP